MGEFRHLAELIERQKNGCRVIRKVGLGTPTQIGVHPPGLWRRPSLNSLGNGMLSSCERAAVIKRLRIGARRSALPDRRMEACAGWPHQRAACTGGPG